MSGIGGPVGNTFRVRTGLKSSRSGAVLAKLGPRFAPAEKNVRQLRAALERALTAGGNQLTPQQHTRLQSIARFERACRALELELRDRQDLTVAESLKIHDSIVRYSNWRDRVIQELLGDRATDPNGLDWDGFMASRPEGL